MKIKVQKWGNSLAVRVPKPLAEETEIREGSTVEITREGGTLVIHPVKEKEYSLDRLVDQITEKNRHGEIGSGDSVGKEAW
jgi:antitoxin MazE